MAVLGEAASAASGAREQATGGSAPRTEGQAREGAGGEAVPGQEEEEQQQEEEEDEGEDWMDAAEREAASGAGASHDGAELKILPLARRAALVSSGLARTNAVVGVLGPFCACLGHVRSGD